VKPAPIALFVYHRPDHARRTIEALRNNELAADSDLIVFSDGPKKDEDAAKVAEVRELLAKVTGFRSVNVVMREHNRGLAQSIITGVSETVAACGKVIVLEEDMVTARYFLRYMNEALDLYEHDTEVISIHGYVYPVAGALPETFFLRGADCWGWATWKRGWDLFESDGRKLLSDLRLRGLEWDFDFDGVHDYTRMLRGQIAGRNDSWAVRWYASAFLRGKLTLYPGTSLVRNIGVDSSGAHCRSTKVLDTELATRPLRLERIPIREDVYARACFVSYFSRSESSLKRMLKALLEWVRCERS
jgi:glycosyltransferase involved in cell wall biosynthesis